LEVDGSQMTNMNLVKFKMAGVRRFKSRFCHKSAAGCPISVKSCVVRQFITAEF